MGFGISIIIAGISGIIGFILLALLIPELMYGTINKCKKNICILISIIGIAIFISFLICVYGNRPVYSSEYKEVPIEKLTIDRVYFEDEEYSLNEPYIIIEEPDHKYNNVVIIEKNHYTVQWIYKFEETGRKYYVYLSEEVYKRLQDGRVLYENKEEY